jgi:hypothetical protein
VVVMEENHLGCWCEECKGKEKSMSIPDPKLFTMRRKADASGVSGTGRVLDGVLFHNGTVVICWRTDVEGAAHGYSSVGVYPSWEAFYFLHIESHPTNETEIEFLP